MHKILCILSNCTSLRLLAYASVLASQLDPKAAAVSRRGMC